MRIFILILFLIVTLFGSAKNIDLYDKIKNIEQSNNCEKNILELELLLKSKTLNNEELLKIQILLINNLIQNSKYDKAASYCQKEIIIAKENKLPLNEASLYIALAKTYYYLNQKDKVKLYNNECLKIAEEYDYLDLLKRCNHNLGVLAFENEGNYKLAEMYFLKAIWYGNKLPDTRQSNLGNQYRMLATTYDILKEFKKADSLFVLTENIFKKHSDTLGIIEALTFHSRMFLSQKEYIKAFEISKESIKISRLIKNEDNLQVALSIYKQICSEMGNYKEAYNASNEILNIETVKQTLTQKKEIADSEARFKVAELKNKQDLAELTAKETKYKYIIIFIIIFLSSTGLILFIYQKQISKKEQVLKLKNLSEVYEAEEKERSRIAKDLHDNMGAYTTSILAQIDLLEYSENEIKIDKLNNLRQDAEFIMSTLRETIWILKTKTISVNQFFDLVKIYADKHLVKNLDLTVTYIDDIGDLKQISPAVSLNLYRIIQEIIQNIIKHSGANQVTFNFSSNEHINIKITDDGKGFDIHNLSSKSGLENMEHRANEINYELIIKSNLGSGTSFELIENASIKI